MFKKKKKDKRLFFDTTDRVTVRTTARGSRINNAIMGDSLIISKGNNIRVYTK
jgi:hypothetical protein